MAKSKFYDRLAEIERIIAAGPQQADFAVFKALVSERTLYEYAFEHLSDPAWVAPLRDAGFFQAPPPVIQDTARQLVSYPWWPETRFLARVASAIPGQVTEILVAVPSTNNGRVHADIIDAANKMSTEFAKRLAIHEMNWIGSQAHLQFLLPRKLTELITKLASSGESDTALDLVKLLLDIFPVSRRGSRTEGDDAWIDSGEPRTRVDTWDYGKILETVVASLAATRPRETLTLLCALLQQAIKGSRASGTTRPEDYSYIWRRSIDAGDDAHPDVKNLLVSAVRDAARHVALGSSEATGFVLDALRQGGWHVFDRLALNLLASMPDLAVDHIGPYLTDQRYFDHASFEREYQAALRTHFGRLAREDKRSILDWIAAGPDVDAWKSFQLDWSKREPSDAEASEYVERWQMSHLGPVSLSLEGDWRDRWNRLTAKYGLPAPSEQRDRAVAYYEAPRAPRTAEEIEQLSVTQLAEFLGNWKPDDGTKSSPQGLSDVLRQVISANPEKYWHEADALRGVPLIYARVLLDSWRTALRASVTVPWDRVLTFCDYVVLGNDGRFTGDDKQVIRWARQAVAELLSTGLETGVVPDDQRSRIWTLLAKLTESDDPNAETEAATLGAGGDAATLSLNATRSVALHGVVRYALWVRRSIEATADHIERLAKGFDEMPEVRQVLDRHLEEAREQSVAVRAVYGQWFPWLALLDSAWAAAAAAAVFPEAENKKRLWDAAWGTYITFCRAYDNVFDVLSHQYGIAVARIADAEEIKSTSVDAKLAEHLMVFYWRGKIELPANGHSLADFYQRAPSALTSHALAFIGQSLTGTKDPIPVRIVERLQAFWEWRLSVAQAAPSTGPFRSELASFGWWFASGQFPLVWATTQLINVLRLVGTIQADYQIVRELPRVAAASPALAIEALRLLFETDKEGLSDGWELHPRVTFETALKNDGPAIQDLVEETIDRLGARGHLEFRDLLDRG